MKIIRLVITYKMTYRHVFRLLLLFSLSIFLWGCQSQKNGTFEIQAIGKDYPFPNEHLVEGLYHHIPVDDDVIGGNTSIRNYDAEHLKWKGNPNGNGYGYFQRNRDLGQVITVPENRDVTVDALVLRTSRGNNAIMEGALNAEMYILFYEVLYDGKLRINENGTSVGENATHGFDHQFNRADDFIEGVEYRYRYRFDGGVFPAIPPTNRYVYNNGDGKPFGEEYGHLHYFRCDFAQESEITLKKGKTYAFLIGFKEGADKRGLALAIDSEVHAKESAKFVVDDLGAMRWGIRREGNGTLPPTMIGQPEPPKERQLLNTLIRESIFPENHFEILPPTTAGFPDVDTYRTLQFYLEIR